MFDLSSWISRDMTLSYRFESGFIMRSKQSTEMTPSSSVTRLECRAVVPPRPFSDHIHCDLRHASGLEIDDAAMKIQESVNRGNDVWRRFDMQQVGRLAFEEALKNWGATANVKLEKCQPWPAGDVGEGQQQWGYCTWLSSEDFQEITVMLHKSKYVIQSAGGPERAAWIATEVQANLCHAESGPN
jgi:hypothetical protein